MNLNTILKYVIIFAFCFSENYSFAQEAVSVKEYLKTFTTYPFSDPDPVPHPWKIYPYFRFDGYTDVPVEKQWKVVELENDYLKIMILPEIGGKIWAAFEKSTGKSFIYNNDVVKFRDVAMRGPWTSGGIEPNYGIIGHTPNCATPVDYITINKPDGSVSCVIGVLDLLTRTSWKIDINLQKDKAYFTTSSFWYNASPYEQPYYTWMNTGIRAGDDLQFIYPGTKYLGHEGEYSDWPVNKKNGKDISWYRNNNFGGYKSYHVFGKYADFFGGYWHNDDFGMGRYSTHDDKAGKKLWIWGLSRQGMIWEKLLTDTNGQYVEVQSGRLFNQASEGSTFTPFKHTGFSPHATDTWTEYWFPVVKTKGYVAANNYGALNIIKEKDWLYIYFSPLQPIQEELKVSAGDSVVYSKKLILKTLQLYKDSLPLPLEDNNLVVTLGGTKLHYESDSSANVISRPVDFPKNFDWKSGYGLYLQGKENLRQRNYIEAEKFLFASVTKDPYFIPSLADYAMLSYRNRNYTQALGKIKSALAIDTYDPAANYYYGIISKSLGNMTDAKDGFDIASLSMEYRSAAYAELSKIYFIEKNYERSIEYARRSIDFNRYAMEAWHILSIIERVNGNTSNALTIADAVLQFDPLNHYMLLEKFLNDSTAANRSAFLNSIANEQPVQTYLEIAIRYFNLGRKEDALKILNLAPANTEVKYWKAFLENSKLKLSANDANLVFPFRSETADILEELITTNDHWLLKYHLALIAWNHNNINQAKKLFREIGDTPGYAPFYSVRAELMKDEKNYDVLDDMLRAEKIDPSQWRYARNIIAYHLAKNDAVKSLETSTKYSKKFPENYIIGMLHIKSLLLNDKYTRANSLLQKIKILPYEGATEGRQLYRETLLMMALNEMEKNNFKKALTYVEASRKWPERLGAGKPHEEDIDERLENWISYNINLQLQNKEVADTLLKKIISFTNNNIQNERPSSGNIISAWAYAATGDTAQAKKYLEDIKFRNPDNKWSDWSLKLYKGQDYPVEGADTTDDNYRILQKWLLLRKP